ncbi:MAG: hypothetical protein GY719_29550 [bacterium]|nr:hypothetical protein [bacterium]
MKIFLASPSDVANYKQATKRVTDRLNEENGVKLGSELFLEVVDWNSHIAPLMSLPESAVLEEVEIGDNDLFLGIAWLSFDNLLGEATPATADFGPSTERNFELAFNSWKDRDPARCLLYRCMRLPEKLTDINGKAFDRITRYFSRFHLGDNNPATYSEFNSSTDLEEQLASRLSAIQQSLEGARADTGAVEEPIGATETAKTPAPAAAPPAEKPASETPAEPTMAEFEKRMQPGKAYEVSFLSIEIVETPQIAKLAKQNPQGVETLYRSFRELVDGTAASYGGEVFSWSDNGGLMIFWSNRSYDHAIMTGLKVLHSLPVFNLDPKQNPIAVGVKTRAAAHDAVIIFQLPSSDISSEDLDFAVQMQRDNTEPAELSITRRLLERIDNRLKPHFKFKGRFEGEPVYACRLPAAEREPEQANLQEFTRRLERRTSQVREILDLPTSDLDISSLEAMSTAIDETYSILNKYCSSFSNVDRDWPVEFFRQLAATTRKMMREEADVWKKLRKCYVSGKLTAGKARRLEAIVQAASRRRSRPVVILDKLEQRCTALAGSGTEEEAAEPPNVDDDLIKKVDVLIKADALDSETALTELLLNRKQAFLEFVASYSKEARHKHLLDKLWETADLILLDDLYSIRGRQRANEQKVFEVLTSAPVEDGRFRLLHKALSQAAGPTDKAILAELEHAGGKAEKPDLQIVWRCTVLGHREIEVRKAAAMKLTPNSMWQAVSLPNVPVASLYAIGERVNKAGNEDAEKIFFDCIRARLEHVVETFRTREEASMLTQLIMVLLDFPFLVETGYFERFDDILRKFLERSQKAGVKVEYFESLRKTLEEARKTADKSPSKPPAGIKKLPLTIQRRLAGEARYVYWFVSHPDPRIAGETLRHVGLMNIERVLRLREVNAAVFGALLKKPELFTRSAPLIAALNHPKCTQNFANRYISTMARSRQGLQELQKLANNPSANPVVRSAAKRMTAARTRGARR